MPIEQKKKQLNKILDKMRTLKSNIGMKIGFGEIDPIEFYDTPFPTVNTLLGGGFPKGKFSVIAGPSMTGKTTLLMQWIGYQMRKDPEFVCLWTDAENALDIDWCQRLGIDIDRLVVQTHSSEPETNNMETLLEQGIKIVGSGSINAWIIDSIGALIPKSEQDKELVEGKMLDLQRKMGEFFRKSNPVMRENKTACVFVGQVYTVPSHSGAFEEVRGGNAVKHWVSVRIKTRRGRKDLGPGEHEITLPDGTKKKLTKGWPQVFKLDKTKINDKESQEVVLQFMYGRGFDSEECAISALFANDVLTKKGAWYHHPLFPEDTKGDHKIQGKSATVEFLQAHPGLVEKLSADMDASLAASFNDSEDTK